jgi:flagellar motor switch protein FliN/FliY
VKQESSGGILSQEEIEMLLNGGKASEPVPATPTPTPAPVPVPTPAQTPQPAVSTPAMVSQPAGIDNSAVQQMMNQMQMQQQMINQMQQMILQMQNSQMNAPKKEAPEPKTINVKPVPQNNLTEGPVSYEEQEENRELIMGVPLEVSVEIGRTRKLVKDILEFTKGSLVILDKLAGEQVDLYVNGRCIAKGDVVVVDDNFGIRITEIIKKNVE